jgi:hypothetical protein
LAWIKTVNFVLALGGHAKTTPIVLGIEDRDPSKFRAARQRKPAGREPTASLPENPAWFLIAAQPIERDIAKSIRDNPKKARGRPATGNSPMVGVRMHEEIQDLNQELGG